MSTRLALAAAGVLAGLAALGSRGSRSRSGLVYHVTHADDAQDILSNGFLGGWGDVGFGVYFFASQGAAERYAAVGGWDGGLKGEPVVILGVMDPRIREIEDWELDPSWDRAKYMDMRFLEIDGDLEDEHVPVERVEIVWSSQ